MQYNEADAADRMQRWQEDIGRLRGVDRVSISPRRIGGAFHPEVDIIHSDADAVTAAEAYFTEHISDRRLSDSVMGIDKDGWDFMNAHVSGHDIMDFFVGSSHIEQAAVAAHDVWRDGKNRALLDTTDPYQGFGSIRRKVRDLSSAERQSLAIPNNADPTKDVYHPLDVPFVDLAPDVQHKNVVPMAAACLAIADFFLDDSARLEGLDREVQSLSQRPDKQALLNKLTHVAWMAGDITSGGRPWNGAQENYHIFRRLTPDVQALDAQATEAPITYIRGKVGPLREASRTLRDTLLRYDGPYAKWWMPELSALGAIAKQDEDPQARAASWAKANNSGMHPEQMRRLWPDIIESALRVGTITVNPNDGTMGVTDKGRRRLETLDVVEGLSWRYVAFVTNYDDIKSRYAV